VTLWWVLPRFESVEVWPGRGYLVACGEDVQFVADRGARFASGSGTDTRFYDPPPIPPRQTTRRPPTRTATGTGDSLARNTQGGRRGRRQPEARSRRAPLLLDEAPIVDPRPTLYADERAPHHRQTPEVRARTSARAETLLISLLDPRQRAEYGATRTFWVHGPFGSVRLGRMYRILQRAGPSHDDERWWCVVTHAHRHIPEADEWSSMLLTLTHDHERFFRVANPITRHARRSATALRDDLYHAIRSCDPIRAAQVAVDLGTISDGAMFEWAERWLRAHAELDPPSRDSFLAHHRALLDRAHATPIRAPASDDDCIVEPRFAMHAGVAIRD